MYYMQCREATSSRPAATTPPTHNVIAHDLRQHVNIGLSGVRPKTSAQLKRHSQSGSPSHVTYVDAWACAIVPPGPIPSRSTTYINAPVFQEEHNKPFLYTRSVNISFCVKDVLKEFSDIYRDLHPFLVAKFVGLIRVALSLQGKCTNLNMHPASGIAGFSGF